MTNGLETCNLISLIIRTGFAVIKRFEHEFNTCTKISSNQITVYTGNCLLIGYTFFINTKITINTFSFVTNRLTMFKYTQEPHQWCNG